MTRGLFLSMNDAVGVRYQDEADIRDALAEYANFAGWDASTEHVVHGWGRPDLYLESAMMTVAVEVKTHLTTPSKCRKAVQQAEGYRVAMPYLSEVYLVAAEIEEDALAPYAEAYPNVLVRTVGDFMFSLSGLSFGMSLRHERALARFRELEETLEKARRVLSDLSNFHDSPLGVNVLAAPLFRSDSEAMRILEGAA